MALELPLFRPKHQWIGNMRSRILSGPRRDHEAGYRWDSAFHMVAWVSVLGVDGSAPASPELFSYDVSISARLQASR